MRILIISVFSFSMISSAFAGLNERDRGSQWFQDCEQEIARPFCGTLKIDPVVQALAWQWQKQAPLDEKPTTSFLDQQHSPEPVLKSKKGRRPPE